MKTRKKTKATKPSRLTKALLETAADMHKTGVMKETGFARLRNLLLEGAASPATGPADKSYFRALRKRVRTKP